MAIFLQNILSISLNIYTGISSPVIYPDCLHLEVHPQGRTQVRHEDALKQPLNRNTETGEAQYLGDSVDERSFPDCGVTSEHHLGSRGQFLCEESSLTLYVLSGGPVGSRSLSFPLSSSLSLNTPRPWPCLVMLACSGMTRVRDLVLLLLPNTEPSPSTCSHANN